MQIESPPDPAALLTSDAPAPADLRPIAHKAASGVIWVIAQSLVGRASLLVGQLVLARILLPKDFGVVGLATTISTISSALVFFGIDQILQQRRHTAHLWATQVFWISLGCGLLGALVMTAFGVVGSEVFHNPHILPLILVIALATPLTVLSTVPQAALQWQLRFGFLSSYTAFESVFTQILIVLLALLGVGALSFVIPVAVMALLKAVVLWRVAKVRLRPLRRSRGWLLIVRRGMTALGSRISNVMIAQGDFIILGLFAPSSVVGAYFFAFRLVSQPMNVLAGSILNVLFSSLLKIDDQDQRARVAFSTAEIVGAGTVPICFLMGAGAKPAVLLLFGAKWVTAIPLIQILSLALPFDAISWPAGSYLIAQGHFARMFRYQTITLPLFFLCALVGVYLGSVIGLALGVAFYYVVHPLIFTGATFRPTAVGWRPVARLFIALMMAAVSSFGVISWVCYAVIPEAHPILQLLFLSVFGPLGYVLGLYIFARRLAMALFTRALGALTAILDRFGVRAPWAEALRSA